MKNDIKKQLFDKQDFGYRDFHSRLMPTIEKERIIGVRTPELKKFAKAIFNTDTAESFLKKLPHYYYNGIG